MSVLIKFTQESIGTPFVENGRSASTGWDCWGLCVSAFKTIGIDLSKYEHIETMDVESAEREITKQVSNWTKIELGKERPWDVVYIRPAHLGVVVQKGKMLHVTPGSETCVVSYKDIAWKNRILGFYRYGELSKD